MNGWLVGILLLSVGCRGAGVVWQQRQGYNKHEWIGQIARFFYFVGIPYLAVVSGLLSPRLFGLRGAEHLALIEWDTSRVLAGIQRAFTLITLEWVFDSPVTITFGTAALLLVWLIRRNLIRHQTPLPNLPQTLLHVFYAALHWAFYRAVVWQLTGDLYLAVVWGAALVFVEWMLIARLSRQQLLPAVVLAQSVILVLTAVIFYYSPNWWLLLPFHWAMVTIIDREVRDRETGIEPGTLREA